VVAEIFHDLLLPISAIVKDDSFVVREKKMPTRSPVVQRAKAAQNTKPATMAAESPTKVVANPLKSKKARKVCGTAHQLYNTRLIGISTTGSSQAEQEATEDYSAEASRAEAKASRK
jgi:hypothetical protein